MSMEENYTDLEQQYLNNSELEHRKKFAQFFTPQPIAEFLCNYVLESKIKPKEILEPAFGLGIFSRVLRNVFNYKHKIDCFEIDDNVIEAGNEMRKNLQINLTKINYLHSWGLNYDAIVCNPPYLKFHDYDNAELIPLLNKKLNLNLSGFTNIYALFILKSISELNEGGRAAYIVPSEFFNSDYGVEIKKYLINTKALKYVVNFHFEETVFDKALTTATILLLEKKKKSNQVVTFFNINKFEELSNIKAHILSEETYDHEKFTYNLEELNPEIKWRNYYQDNIKHNSNILVNFKKYCKAKRGIATGANEYFSFTLDKAKIHNIKKDNLLPCICRSADIDTLFFTKSHFEELANNGKKVFLVDLRIWPDDHTNNYIKLGVAEEVNEKFLTKNRSPWYAIENKKPADIWVGVFNRDSIKFIQNNTDSLNLTTFHGIYINTLYKKYKDIIFAYLLTNLSKELFDVNKREYGNGLSKYEPNDFNNSNIFDFEILTRDQINHISSLIVLLKETESDELKSKLVIEQIDEYFRNLI
jgi:adenine-specific DNA-methyltransferase